MRRDPDNMPSHKESSARLGYTQFLSLAHAHRVRIARYAIVGLTISVAYSLLVIALVHFIPPLGPTIASALAFVVILPFGYLSHNSVTFGDRLADRFQPARFAITTISSFLISVGGMYWITEVARQSYLLGIAWNWMVIPASNFLIYMFWVFRDARPAGPQA